MIYFTADLHFYHRNIISATNRPFSNEDEMNRVLIQNWNNKVSSDDDIYILGDFTMKGPELATSLLYGLKGKKHLIRGNHDSFVDKASFDRSLFVSVQDYMEIVCFNTLFVLSHYPMVEWNGYYKDSIMLHGHQHNHADYNTANRKNGLRRYDVGVDANQMTPVSAEEIIDFFGC